MKKIADIRFYPSIKLKPKTKSELLRIILKSMSIDGGIQRTGYANKAAWRRDLNVHLGHKNISRYVPLSPSQEKTIKAAIKKALVKCYKALPHPDLPVFVFVYPWIPSANDRILFDGVMGLSSYYTMHIFIDAEAYTPSSLRQTIAHEWHHLVFFRLFPEKHYDLRSHIIMEGGAEIFREEVMGGQHAPWSLAINRKEAARQLRMLKSSLSVKGMQKYREVFFGNKKYKRWTGYAIGYHLVKNFRLKNRRVTWINFTKKLPNILLKDEPK